MEKKFGRMEGKKTVKLETKKKGGMNTANLKPKLYLYRTL